MGVSPVRLVGRCGLGGACLLLESTIRFRNATFPTNGRFLDLRSLAASQDSQVKRAAALIIEASQWTGPGRKLLSPPKPGPYDVRPTRLNLTQTEPSLPRKPKLLKKGLVMQFCLRKSIILLPHT